MFQKKCIVCNQYKFSEEFSDELNERGGYGLICRNCLLNRQFIRYEKSFNNPSDNFEEADIEDKSSETPVEPLDKESLDENSNFYNKIRIEYLDVSSIVKEKLLTNGIRTFGGVKFTDSEKIDQIKGLTAGETKEVLIALSKIPYSETKLTNYETTTAKTVEGPSNNELLVDVVKEVANAYKISVSDVLSKSRRKEFTQARFVVVHILRNHLGCSYPKIAKLLYRDHTTIIHADNAFKHDAEFNPKTEEDLIRTIVTNAGTRAKSTLPDAKTQVGNQTLPPPQPKPKTKEVNVEKLASTLIDERNFKIFILYKKGLTLEEISSDFTVTRERVRQICHKVSKIFAARQILIMGSNAPSLDVAYEVEKKLHDAAVRARYLEKNPKKIKKPYKLKGWSRFYERCLSCGSTKNKHFRNGLCEVCGKKTISGEQRETIISEHGGKCDKCGISRNDCYKKFNRDFYISRKDKSVLCMQCFRKKTGTILGNRTRVRSSIPTPIVVTGELWAYKNKLTVAYGKFINPNFIVLKDSQIDPSNRKSYLANKSSVATRSKILEANAVMLKDGSYRLTKDIKFESPSAAATFCGGGNVNGWISWRRVKDNATLDQVYRNEVNKS